jgi:REP element-mobilizing transposase RayT
MPQSLVEIYLHLVFSTKNREPFLKDPDIRAQMHAYLGGVCRNLECPALIAGGTEDHAHLLCRYSQNITVANLFRDLKRSSSLWIKEQSAKSREFYWQRGYGAFSISPSHIQDLTAYILNQEMHHRKISFQEEFRKLCRKYGIEIDERYVWD